jgi:hypothetical protein
MFELSVNQDQQLEIVVGNIRSGEAGLILLVA